MASSPLTRMAAFPFYNNQDMDGKGFQMVVTLTYIGWVMASSPLATALPSNHHQGMDMNHFNPCQPTSSFLSSNTVCQYQDDLDMSPSVIPSEETLSGGTLPNDGSDPPNETQLNLLCRWFIAMDFGDAEVLRNISLFMFQFLLFVSNISCWIFEKSDWYHSLKY